MGILQTVIVPAVSGAIAVLLTAWIRTRQSRRQAVTAERRSVYNDALALLHAFAWERFLGDAKSLISRTVDVNARMKLYASRVAASAFNHAYSAVVNASDGVAESLVRDIGGGGFVYGFGDDVADVYVGAFEAVVRQELGVKRSRTAFA
jgi:hypothetical protein